MSPGDTRRRSHRARISSASWTHTPNWCTKSTSADWNQLNQWYSKIRCQFSRRCCELEIQRVDWRSIYRYRSQAQSMVWFMRNDWRSLQMGLSQPSWKEIWTKNCFFFNLLSAQFCTVMSYCKYRLIINCTL